MDAFCNSPAIRSSRRRRVNIGFSYTLPTSLVVILLGKMTFTWPQGFELALLFSLGHHFQTESPVCSHVSGSAILHSI